MKKYRCLSKSTVSGSGLFIILTGLLSIICTLSFTGCTKPQLQDKRNVYEPINFEVNDSLLSSITTYDPLRLQIRYPQNWQALPPSAQTIFADSLSRFNPYQIIDTRQSSDKQHLAFFAKIQSSTSSSLQQVKDSLIAVQKKRSDKCLVEGKFRYNDIMYDQIITVKGNMTFLFLIGEPVAPAPGFVVCYIVSTSKYLEIIKSIEASISSIKVKKE